MNPYGGQNPGQFPQGGQQQGGYSQGGYQQGGSPQGGYPQQGGSPQGGYQVPGQPVGYPAQQPPTTPYGGPPNYGGYPPQPPQPPNGGGNRKGLMIGLTAVVAILVVAAVAGAWVILQDKGSTSTSPVTFSAAPTTGVPTTGAAPTTGGAPATESDGFLTTTAPSSGTPGSTAQVPLKLTAGGSGAGVVQLSGLSGSSGPPPAAVLPWEWQGLATIGETLTLRVVGTGEVICSISVNGREISTRSGTNTVTCGIKRSTE